MQRVRRVQSANTNGRVGYCLDVLELFLSKAYAGRDKHREFCIALLECGYVTVDQVLKMVPTMPLEHKQQRTLRATIRRWATAVRQVSGTVPKQ